MKYRKLYFIVVLFVLIGCKSTFEFKVLDNEIIDESVILNDLFRLTNKHCYYTSDDSDSMEIYISKGTTSTQVEIFKQNQLLIGERTWEPGISEIIITFSKPIIGTNFFFHSLNNDASGKEIITDFEIITENDRNITSSSRLFWKNKFPYSEDFSTMSLQTIFDPVSNTISATEGNCCKTASGRIFIENNIPFNKVKFKIIVTEGTPYGVYLANAIRYVLPKK